RAGWRFDGAGAWPVCLDNLADPARHSVTISTDHASLQGAPAMNALSIRCIKAAFVYLAFGIGLGAWFAVDRAAGALLRPLHAELNLWGWTTLLIYGMAYHMLPRFAGRPVRWPRLAAAQAGLAIGGVALVAAGWVGVLSALP